MFHSFDFLRCVEYLGGKPWSAGGLGIACFPSASLLRSPRGRKGPVGAEEPW